MLTPRLTYLWLYLVLPALGQRGPSEIYQEVKDAVVLITGEHKRGSGVIVSDDGLVVTSFHVVSGERSVSIKLVNGLELATDDVVAADALLDVAVLQLSGRGFHRARLGNSDEVSPGDPILVISNPLGLEGSVTNGLVSGIRDWGGGKVLQISAPISPGSSGGPVFDRRGQVIGLARATLIGGQNLNLAVPSNTIQSVLRDGKLPSKLSALRPAEGHSDQPASLPQELLAKIKRYLDNDMNEEALNEARSAIEADEFNPRLRTILGGLILPRFKLYDEGIHQLEIAHKLDQRSWTTKELLADLYLKRWATKSDIGDRLNACRLYTELSSSQSLRNEAGADSSKAWESRLGWLREPSGTWVSGGERYRLSGPNNAGVYHFSRESFDPNLPIDADVRLGGNGVLNGEGHDRVGGCYTELAVEIRLVPLVQTIKDDCGSSMQVGGILTKVVGPMVDFGQPVTSSSVRLLRLQAQACFQTLGPKVGTPVMTMHLTRVPYEIDRAYLGVN